MVSPFAALADPLRRQILETLADGELPAGDLAQKFPVSQPAISHHLRTLRQANLVHVRVRGQQRLYSLNPIGFSELGRWLAHMERFWVARLSLLEKNLRSRSTSRGAALRTRRAKSRVKR